MSSVRLAVCIPAYNQPAFLREALTSLCDQGLDRRDYAVVVCDDGSPTPLAPVADEFRERLTIVYHRHATNLGHLANWDAAWRLVDAPFLSFLAHDDVMAPGHLARALAVIEADPNVALVSSLILCQSYPGATNTRPHGLLLRGAGRATFSAPYRWGRDEWMALALVTTPNSLIGSIFRIDAFRQCRDWVTYPIWHDRLMLGEAGLHGDVVTLPWIAGHYRTGEWQLSGRLWEPEMGEFRKASEVVLGWCEAKGIAVVPFWVEQVCAASADDRLLYLQMLRASLDEALFADIKHHCETRLKRTLRLGRLERLGLPPSIAALLRSVDRKFMRRGV